MSFKNYIHVFVSFWQYENNFSRVENLAFKVITFYLGFAARREYYYKGSQIIYYYAKYTN